MKKVSRMAFLSVGFAAAMAAVAQTNFVTNGPPPLTETNIYQAGVQSFITNGASPANMKSPTNVNEAAGAVPVPTTNVATNHTEKPAVHVTLDGTVLTPGQKAEIEQRLKDIPGIVMINDRIHVVGEIREPAGVATTNFVRTNAPPSRQQKHKPQAF